MGQPIPPAGQVTNPYFLNETPIAQAKQFSHADQDIYLVSRLDGYNRTDIKALIDRGFAPSKEGKILLDGKGSSEEKGDAWLKVTADQLTQMGFKDRVLYENSKTVLTGVKKVLGYYSWGTGDPEIRIRRFDFELMPGALAGMFVGTDGRTFNDSSMDSCAPQSLAADLIREGITGISAHVSDPFLEGTIRPNILFYRPDPRVGQGRRAMSASVLTCSTICPSGICSWSALVRSVTNWSTRSSSSAGAE
jgi:uncharacterized protein (TIGR03790 family)